MNVVKDRLTYQQIHVVWPYGSIRLQQLDMLQEWGEHARISVQGSIDPMLAESLLKEASADDNIELWYDDEQDTRRPLFMGQLYDVQVLHAPEEATVQLEIISHSFKLDTEFKNRSFQRVDQQFVEIVDAVLADYPGADKIDEAFGKQATGQFILQYQETDWVFLQRLASHAGATLIPNTLSHRPQIWIGVPQTGKQIRLEGVPFTLQRNLAPYLDQVTNRGA
uniref:contractile injection system protein, VgrG/Pvc8 family n=1 Tax=Paenibacillus massiliensis TaxID=225917 RepID=UPI000471C43D